MSADCNVSSSLTMSPSLLLPSVETITLLLLNIWSTVFPNSVIFLVEVCLMGANNVVISLSLINSLSQSSNNAISTSQWIIERGVDFCEYLGLRRVGLYESVSFENFVLWRPWWRPVALDVHLMWTQLFNIVALRRGPLMDSLRRPRCKSEP